MWISKRRYEALVRVADNNRDDAEAFRKIFRDVNNALIIRHNECVIMTRDVYTAMTDMQKSNVNEIQSLKDRIKDIDAEREWYKVKYHEMKQKNEKG